MKIASISKIAARFATSPREAYYELLAGRNPRALFLKYTEAARRQGVSRPTFILSFDCDTDDDISVVDDVHGRCLAAGVMPVYAAPFELLKRGEKTFRRIAESGAEFINHGYYTHTFFDISAGRYKSCFFYDQLPPEAVKDDIRRGHEAHVEFFGKAPLGFRAPHFGTFQKPAQLRLLHNELSRLGYRYSSSTVPLYGFMRGPLADAGGLVEIPVSGCFDEPLSVLDSWSFRAAPDRIKTEKDYIEQFRKMVDFFAGGGRPGLLNFYADPCHVHDWPEFFNCLKLAAPIAARSYSEALAAAGK